MNLPKHLQCLNLNAAGIDIGSKSHFVAVPVGTDDCSSLQITKANISRIISRTRSNSGYIRELDILPLLDNLINTLIRTEVKLESGIQKDTFS